jgi:hypothetical protein
MPNQTRQSEHSSRTSTHPSRALDLGELASRPSKHLDRHEWELVVTLPRRVLLAAVAAAPADGRRAAEGIAGIEAIASGLASDSPLVREAVNAIYAESYQDSADAGEDTDVITVRTLAACRYAAQVVARRCGAADADAYRKWLLHIAAVVTGVAQGVAAPAAGPGRGPSGLTGATPGAAREPATGSFLYALDGVLRPD